MRAMTKPGKYTWLVALALALAFIVVYGHMRGYEIQSGMIYNSVKPKVPEVSLNSKGESTRFHSYEATNGTVSSSGVYRTR